MRWLLFLLLIAPGGVLWADRNDPPGARYPAMKISFIDPLTGRSVWRMTTDAKQSRASNLLGDLSSETTAWSPDATRIAYVKKGHPDKPDGVYVMDVSTGVETVVAVDARAAYAVFSRSTNEIFYSARTNGWPRSAGAVAGEAAPEPSVQVSAVRLDDYSVRVLKAFPGAVWIGPAVQNCDGSLIALFPSTGDVAAASFNDLSEQCVIVDPQGDVQPGWEFHPDYSCPFNADFALWHPTDSKLVVTRRFLSPTSVATRLWHVETLENPYPGNRKIGHSAWHPNGRLMLENDLWDLATGQIVKPLSIGGPHKNFNPADGALGLEARVCFDARKPPYVLFVRTLSQLPAIDPVERERLLKLEHRTAEDNRQLWYVQETDPAIAFCQHYSDFSSHAVHPHAHWSPDGSYLLWQSNVAYAEHGAPPGGVGTADNAEATDLFVVPVDAD